MHRFLPCCRPCPPSSNRPSPRRSHLVAPTRRRQRLRHFPLSSAHCSLGPTLALPHFQVSRRFRPTHRTIPPNLRPHPLLRRCPHRLPQRSAPTRARRNTVLRILHCPPARSTLDRRRTRLPTLRLRLHLPRRGLPRHNRRALPTRHLRRPPPFPQTRRATRRRLHPSTLSLFRLRHGLRRLLLRPSPLRQRKPSLPHRVTLLHRAPSSRRIPSQPRKRLHRRPRLHPQRPPRRPTPLPPLRRRPLPRHPR